MTSAKPLVSTLKCLTLLFFVGSGAAVAVETVSADDMKNYQLGLSDPTPAENVVLAPVIAQWTFAPGSPLKIAHPFEQAKIDILVADSQYLNKGTQVATISGPSVTHFYHRLDVVEQQFKVAEQRYQSNQRLFEDNAIAAEQWQQTLTHFLQQADQYHEIQVFAERFQQIDDNRASFSMPADGIWQLSDSADVLGMVMAQEDLRIGAQVPQQIAPHVRALVVGNNQYNVSFREQSSNNGMVTLWSEPARQDPWRINQILSAKPSITVENAVQIPATALTSLAGQATVFVVRNNEFIPVAVDVVAQRSDFYVVVPQQTLGGQIVTESIGALKGIYSDEEQ
ncbi:MAG: hypothetical protein ACQEQZ_01265 [Pseudomonadota bacterium]